MRYSLLLFVLLIPASLLSQIIYIPDNYPSIQQGIENANTGDTIIVKPGTYFENIDFLGKNITVTSNFILTNDTAFISQTIIDGMNGGTHVVSFKNNEDSTSILNGLTITNGKSLYVGGGIYCYSASPTLSNLKIINNTAEDGGGGIWLYKSKSILKSIYLTNNTAKHSGGGGIEINNSSIKMYSIDIIDNIGTGFVSENSSESYIDNSNINYNSGRGISGSNINLINSVIKGNNNTGISGGQIVIEYSTVLDNVGGGVDFLFGYGELSNVVIKNNYGFGIKIQSGKLSNVTIAKNYGLGIQTNGDVIFDSLHRCNIYSNSGDGTSAKDIINHSLNNIFLDTCTVLYPTEFHCEPTSNFILDIQHGIIEQTKQNLYVSPSGSNNNSGLSKDEPLKTIDYALAKNLADSNNQQTIYLAEGIYSQSTNEEFLPINIPDYIDLIGESKDNVIIDGSEDAESIIFLWWNNNNTISGLTIKGAGVGVSPHSSRGIYSRNSNTILTNLLITENHGYGVYLLESNTVMDYLEVTKNKNTGITLFGFAKILNSTISENGWEHCGGIDLDSSVHLENVKITNNSVTQNGGGICGRPSVTSFNVIIENNSADRGGGVYMNGGKIENIQLLNNTADLGGGVYMNGGHPISFKNVLFAGNSARKGGAFFTYEDGGEISFLNSTISNNTAESGGGIYIYGEEGRVIKITNSILWYNYSNEIFLKGNGSPIVSISRSDIYGGQSQIVNESNGQVIWFEGNITENPNFVNSGDNPYNLTSDSPCIDTGRPDTIGLNLPPGDIIGYKRIWDGNNDGSEIIDMGAYEYGSIPLSVNEQVLTSSIVNIYPNPFIFSTIIEYDLEQPSTVTITIYNYHGGQVEVFHKNQSSGKQKVIWDAKGLPPGMYYFTLRAGDQIGTGKMVLLR